MKKIYSRIIAWSIIIVLLVYVLRKFSFTELYTVIKQANPLYFALAFVLFSISVVLFNLRTMFYLKKTIKPKKQNFWFFLETLLAGNFINIITPGAQVGGEPIRAYYISKKYKKPISKIFGIVMSERIMHAFVSLVFIVFSILLLIAFIPIPDTLKTVFQTFLFFIFILFGIILFLNLKKTKFDLDSFFKKFKWLAKFNPLKKNKKLNKDLKLGFGHFTNSFKKSFFNKKTFFYGFLISFLHWGVFYSVSYLLFVSLDIKINFFFVIAVVSLGSLIGDLSPSPGGIGLIEAFMVFLYSLIGINFSAALIVAVLSRAITYFYSLLLGSILLAHLDNSLA